MEAEVLRLLTDAQSPQETPRRQAEAHLRVLNDNENFGPCLLSIASQTSLPLAVRQGALSYCKIYLQHVWSSSFDEYEGHAILGEPIKQDIRQTILNLATSPANDRKIRVAATAIVSKIASADVPDEWPSLLDTILHTIQHASSDELHGPLKLLYELVDDCFTEAQFFRVARELVGTVHHVAINEAVSPALRALAVCVFCSCFNMLEMIMEDNKAAVKGFAEGSMNAWTPFFLDTLKMPMPSLPAENDSAIHYRSVVSLKLQVVKVLMRARSVFPSVLTPLSPTLFSCVWDELQRLLPQYHVMYIENNYEGRLEDADGLPHSLDFLVLELLDFMQGCLRAPPVRKQLEYRLEQAVAHADGATNGHGSENWVDEIVQLAIAYAHITTEEEALWTIDVNTFLSEEASVTANYTPRSACGGLMTRLGEWLLAATTTSLLTRIKSVFADKQGWKAQEAALYALDQLLCDLQQVDRVIDTDAAASFSLYVQYALQHENVFLRARGHLVAGSLVKTSGEALLSNAPELLNKALLAMRSDPSDIVQIASVKGVQRYLSTIPPATTLPLQPEIISSLTAYLSHHDLNDFDDNEDVMMALLETLRDALLLNTTICLDGPGLDILFMLANHGAGNFQVATLITETFDEITGTLSASGQDNFTRLCTKVLPSLASVLDAVDPTEPKALTPVAAEMLATLVGNGPSPLPQGFVQVIMPNLRKILLESQDTELLNQSTMAVRAVIEHDVAQVLGWQDASGKEGLEVILSIIGRLLSDQVEDSAAAEVGGLASALVEKAGQDVMGPYVVQLLGAVAARIADAEQAAFVQSLVSVFSRLALVAPREMLDFLVQTRLSERSALQVVMSKWLENSSSFVGYDEIRQSVIALSKLYEHDDGHLEQVKVKGDLNMPADTGRIKTRSQARAQPDQYTQISAKLKLIKILVEELSNSAGAQDLDADAAAAMDEELSGEEWEDEPNAFANLESQSVKEQLMAYGAGDDGLPARGRDDETQAFLSDWFKQQAKRTDFANVYNSLTLDEQAKLSSVG